ncbi:MAG: riboflavin kinase [Brevinema sp.]
MLAHLIRKIPKLHRLHIIIGAFDGLHKAHKKIIEKTISLSKKKDEASLIFTFEPLPKEYFSHHEFYGRLLPKHIKKEFLEKLGADYVIIADFESIKNFSEKEFIDIFLTKANYISLYSGDDFRFGLMNGAKYTGDRVVHIKNPEFNIHGYSCRSTNIRKLLTEGDIETANRLLGYEYKIYSKSKSGDKIGRTIGFPTINISPNKQLVPQHGVYFTEILLYDRVYPSMTYIGKRPTLQGKELRIETHIIDHIFNIDIPEKTDVEITFIKKIADEKTFKSLDNLQEMLYNYKKISLALATERYKFEGIGSYDDQLTAEES